MDAVNFLRSKGYPRVIKGNGGYRAVLVNIQLLVDGEYEAIYRYPGGDCCHGLEEIKSGRGFEIVEM